MTDRVSGPTGGSRRPLARVALLAIPGGITVGAVVGVKYSLIFTVQGLLFDPTWLGGTGSPGLGAFGALVGLAVGAGYGLVVGLATWLALALCWLLAVPSAPTVGIGAVAVLATSVGFVAWTVGIDPATLLVPLYGSAHGIAGVILLVWVASLRPRDYWAIIEQRSTMAKGSRAPSAP